MAIVQRIKIGDLTLEIESERARHSGRIYGYIIRNLNDDEWSDGGWSDRAQAERRGREHVARLRRQGY